jgi:hypothetical protein
MTFFYDLNKKLNGIRELPTNNQTQLNEGDYSKDAMALNPDFAKVGKKPGMMDKLAQGVKKVADFVAPGDEDLLRDLERKTGGRRPAEEAAAPMTPKQKSFAKLAPPADKITFADKIAGAKKEVDEMLGDVAAEAMKAALGKGKQPVRGMGEATKEIPGGRRHTSEPGGYGRKDDEEAPKVQTQRGRGRPKKNADSETGQVMKPDWSAFGVGKVNLPKHKGAVTKHKMVGEAVSEDDIEVLERLMDEAFAEGNNALGNALQTALERIQGDQDEGRYDDEQVNEKAVSKKQQKFMGMVHAAQKGEKPASKEVAKVAKEMPKKEAEKFAKTKHKGLPDKVKEEDTDTRDTRAEKAGKRVTKDIEYDEKAKDGDHGKKRGPQDAKAEKAGKKVAKDIEHDEKVDETTVSGSVAPTGDAGGKKAKGGMSFGKGIYDSWNRELENMISESINISVNMSNGSETGAPTKSITVSAEGDDAERLAELLQMAGMNSARAEPASSCGAEQMDENQPDWPTNTEYSDDAFQYSGGLNKPKSTGQTTAPVIASQDSRQHSYDDEDEDDLARMMEMAGVKKKSVDEEKTEEGNLFTGNLAKARAAGKKEADLDGDGKMEKVDESIFDMTRNLWKSYNK